LARKTFVGFSVRILVEE